MDELPTLERETARQRALRIPLAYHRSRGTLVGTKLGLALAIFLGGGLYLAWVLGGGKPAATQVSPGTLANDHARWESDCKACHLPFVPQRSDADGTRLVSKSLGGLRTNDIHYQTDAKCSECHKLAVTHQVNQIAEEVESCVACHRDHQGRDFDMARMDDTHCTACHASIAEHRQPQGSHGNLPIVNVTAFELGSADANSGHPSFRSLTDNEDPGNIRFSHRLHMTPGQLYPGQTPPPGKEPVVLKCESCHTPTAELAGDGAYMQPIKFEQHCRSCHLLHVPGRGDAAIPHGLKAAQLEATVARSLAEQDSDDSVATPMPKRLIPGKTPRRESDDGLMLPPKLLAAQRLQEVRTNVCAKCHSWQSTEPAEVMPAAIPAVWLTRAKFSHKPHRTAVKCEDCHSQASEALSAAGQPGQLADDDRVMIPNIDNCARCHAPRNEAAGTGGARFDCAQCHQYHNLPAKLTASQPILASQISMPKSQAQTSHPYVGARSCSATGCHGAAKGNSVATSYTKFASMDPHGRAFLRLYTQQSLAMARVLTNQPLMEMEQAAYISFLQQKCIGCHATPPAEEGQALRPESYSAGVSCESCHGPAKNWEFSHFTHPKRPGKKEDLPQPHDLTDHAKRTTICAECHIGPQVTNGRAFEVNHDLIAAGHPRLTFESEAQLANLSVHWDPNKLLKSPAPHFTAWRLGELATAAQQDELHNWRKNQQKASGKLSLEFANHRCFDCHHGLSPKPAAGRVAFPPLAKLTQEQRKLLSRPTPSKQEQANLLLKLLGSVTDNRSTASAGSRWEEYVRFSLALSAYLADNPQSGDLAKHSGALQTILNISFRSLPSDRRLTKEATFAGSPYDSPTGFDPKDEKLQQVVEDIRASLTSP